MSKTYLADKQTLDSVNSKVGASSDAESGTPTTLFAGLKNIIKGIIELKNLLSDGKTRVANAITGKGISTATNATFATMANNINAITTLSQGTGDANATASQILSGKTAYVKGNKITGTIPSRGAATITPGTNNQTIGAGQYLSGNQTIAGSGNLVPGNIKQGVNIFGVVGSFSGIDFSELQYIDTTTTTIIPRPARIIFFDRSSDGVTFASAWIPKFYYFSRSSSYCARPNGGLSLEFGNGGNYVVSLSPDLKTINISNNVSGYIFRVYY